MGPLVVKDVKDFLRDPFGNNWVTLVVELSSAR